MNLFAVMGYGPNDLTIPLVMFLTKEEADAFVAQFPQTEQGWLASDFAEKQGVYVDEDTYELTEEGERLYGMLFKDADYYAGCGGCYSIGVEEVEIGKPMVGWDLD